MVRSHRRRVALATAGAATLIVAGTAFGQCEIQQLLASDGTSGDWFGYAAAAAGDVVVVGARYARPGLLIEAGAVYVYEPADGAFAETAILSHADAASGDRLGTSVAVDGLTIVAGSPTHDQPASLAGAAYVFEKIDGAWAQAAKLTADDGAEGDQFGDEDAVDIDGDTIVVGAWRHDGAVSDTGAAYVFERGDGSWPQSQKLEASDAAQTNWFGGAVAVDGDVIVVGAQRDDDLGSSSGSAYVFERSKTGWTETAKLLPDDGVAFDEFGDSVAIDGGVIIVGVPKHGVPENIGAVYVFENVDGAWVQTARLLDGTGESGDRFGEGLAIREDRIAVGSWFDDDDDLGTASGSISLFERDGASWVQTAKVTASDGAFGDKLGRSVALTDSLLVGGAYWDDENGNDSGSTYVFTFVETPDCDGNGQLDACDMRLGISFDCNANGLPDTCDIAAGADADCDSDTVPDGCQTYENYALDDGIAEENLFTDIGYELVWLNGFTVSPGGELVTGIANTWWDNFDGEPITYLLYDDPNDDGDPSDAVLLGAFPAETSTMDQWETEVTPIEPTYVGEPGDRFFVGAWYTQSLAVAAAIDVHPPYQAESWVTIADSGTVDLEVLTNNTNLPLSRIADVCNICGAGGNWMLRAHTAAVGPCDCPGDIDGSGAVDIDDIIEVVLNFGQTGTPGRPGDADFSGTVDIDDVVEVVLHFGTQCA